MEQGGIRGREETHTEIESFERRATSMSSSQHPDSTQTGNGEFELEMVAKEQKNRAMDAGEACEKLLLDSSKAGALKRREFFDNLLKLTLLLGPPGSGKSTLLRALAGQLDKTLKIMGLEICADTMVGDAMRRGISGGQKKRLTTAEMIVGPAKAFFMDEISNGLDSSTTFQIIKCFQQLASITECTMLISLLQPTPEVFDLFKDLILIAEGKLSVIALIAMSVFFRTRMTTDLRHANYYMGALFFSIFMIMLNALEAYHGSIPRKSNLEGEEINAQKELGDHMKMPMEAKTSIPIMKLALTFRNLNYYVVTPPEMLKQGYPARKLQLLHSVTGVLRPGVLSALMGASGAGKTTLLDVLAGRKTGGSVEGDIRIGGYPKLTVKESVTYSAWLRLPPQVDGKTRHEFVNEVLKIVELDEIKDTLVGIQGINGLSLEQRKRLTVAVELISNPSVILMDEPTTGLDARSAAIVIRAVKNISETGRTVVCTIHQPSIDIFEAFDELILMKNGGKIIYGGPIGKHSCKVVEYFQKIPGVPRIKRNCNPATWMMDVTSRSTEVQLNIDFARKWKSLSSN
ncbi:hypothetical protein PR202_gb11825 [Eleusine coracana subsp. coracana]|uniref:ABC transporter domain-containing protein n=1 Tax=Eleusine coracana subsp. coracana TaxID=191504 RepID=A0AAV5EMP1_ELECO|nr:hypothetical protein PR202_gb11825 [Eleusine coracana subsp. coracana]